MASIEPVSPLLSALSAVFVIPSLAGCTSALMQKLCASCFYAEINIAAHLLMQRLKLCCIVSL